MLALLGAAVAAPYTSHDGCCRVPDLNADQYATRLAVTGDAACRAACEADAACTAYDVNGFDRCFTYSEVITDFECENANRPITCYTNDAMTPSPPPPPPPPSPPAGPAAAGDGPSAPLPETDAPAPRAPLHPAAADASSAVPGLTFQPTTIRPVERRHDRGIADDNVAFDGAAGGERKSPSDAVSMPDEIEGKQDARESTVDLIDPEAFDLYDTPSPDTDAGSPATDDSISIRLDLARMYIDMSDPESARELLLDVKAHGDAAQRAHAERLLGEI